LKGEFSPEETACYVLAIARESNPSIEEATEEKWEEIENYGDPENIGGIYAGLKAINKSEQELDESKELLAIAMELTTKMEQELKKVQEELRMVNQNLQAKEAEIQKNDEIYVNLLVEIHEKY
jgi:exonuclease VII small subunit